MIKGNDPGDEVNTSGFAGSMATYAAVVAGVGAALTASGRDLPGLVVTPRPTRTAAVVAVSDTLHQAYTRLRAE